MWHSDHDHTEEEIKVLRELEYDLFMYDPGFRRIWQNDFNGYFHSLFDEQAWESKMNQVFAGQAGAESGISQKMLADPEFARYMKEQVIIEEVLAGELQPEHAPVEMRQQLEQIMAEQNNGDGFEMDIEIEQVDIKDQLFLDAAKWASGLSKQAGPLYEQFGNIQLFRILANCYIVSGKIAFAQEPDAFFPESGYQWQADRVGYSLALTSLRRCMESLEKLRKNLKIAKRLDLKGFAATARTIQTGLMDRLDEIEQMRLQKRI
jgi:hypothetical protein